jgi:1,2-beta-oligoglucan phosphorylase
MCVSDSDTLTFQDKTNLVHAELRNEADLAFSFLENGSIFTMTHGGILINQVPGNPFDGGLGNIYVRRHHDQAVSSFPVLGPNSDSRFFEGDRAVSWRGSRAGLGYQCLLQLAPDETFWFWTLTIRNNTAEAQLVDAVLAQDLGLGEPAAVRTNELYTSQYIDHTVYNRDRYGFIVCSRQNQQQAGTFPWIMQGCFQGADGYLTDGFQFFGLEYRDTNVPIALTLTEFPNTTYQYELAFPALKTRRFVVPPGGSVDVTFFAAYVADHPQATTTQDLARVAAAERAFQSQRSNVDRNNLAPLPKIDSVFNSASLFASQLLTPEDLDRYFNRERRHLETNDGTILSFFYGSEYHVVTKEKELLTERPHGHIIRSGESLFPNENALSLTAWMCGVFSSHVAIGNTNFNKLLTISRNPLNALKSSGQRMFVKTSDGYALLGLPSAFEMGLNSARWIYKGDDLTILVRVWTSMRDPACFLEISVENSVDVEFLISHNLVLGDAEFETCGRVRFDEDRKRAELVPAANELMAQRYPDARFYIVPGDADAVEDIGGDRLLFADGCERANPYVVFKTRPVRCFTLVITGNILDAQQAADLADRYADRVPDPERSRREADTFWHGIGKNAALRCENRPDDVSRLDDVLPWYTHNAVHHFATLYGLEQYSGAAWGVRDVCQGPLELLLATRNFDTIKRVLKTVYAHQLHPSGDWPQWFMFDRYWDIYAPDSHADVVIWPLKAVCDYVEATDDLAILDEQIPCTDEKTRAITSWTRSLFDHTLRQVDRLEPECMPGTALARYGLGDWEDTLQPADPAARLRWVSPWTVELAFQTLGRYARVCERAGRSETSERLIAFRSKIKDDFNRYLIRDGITAGLVDFGPEAIDYLLHPSDRKTGVSYRLLPMTRGMIGEIFTPEQMRQHLAAIDAHLTFPDGVRLMDRPIVYHGGTEELFKRAESSANFGREIGLQYVHAHLRYIEAMAKVGRPDRAFRALMAVVPIGIQKAVPSAMPRQSNAYFSSSDAAFKDRYEALEQFDRIKTLEVGIKGGWRIYSSGPGLFVGQLILNILGLRELFSDVVLDPVLPKSLDGLTFDFDYAGRPVRYLYHVSGQGFSPERVTINGADVTNARHADNPYRAGGVLIPKSDFIQRLDGDSNLVEIHI